MINGFAILGLTGIASVAFIVLLVLIFIFEVWMLVSAIVNKNISNNARVWWIIGMVLIHPIVAIVYYFTDYKKSKTS